MAHDERAARKRWALAALVLVVLLVLVVPGCSTSATSRLPSTLPARDVSVIDMLSASTGVALGVVVDRGRERATYLMKTSDGGVSWSVDGAFPVPISPWGGIFGAQLAFATTTEGYVWVLGVDGHPGTAFFTKDAGVRWTRVQAPGSPQGVSYADGTAWIVSLRCPNSSLVPSLCPSALASYPLGAVSPASVVEIPTEGVAPAPGVSSRTWAATLLDRISAASGVFVEGQEGGPSSLLLTADGGRSWTLVTDPCGELFPRGLVSTGPADWDVYCELDGGMEQGTVQLLATSDGGLSWHLVAEGGIMGPRVGNIGDGIIYNFAASGDGRTLWLLFVVGAVAESQDGGVHWSSPSFNTGGTTDLDAAGPTSAWVPVAGLGLFATTNGTTWTKLS